MHMLPPSAVHQSSPNVVYTRASQLGSMYMKNVDKSKPAVCNPCIVHCAPLNPMYTRVTPNVLYTRASQLG